MEENKNLNQNETLETEAIETQEVAEETVEETQEVVEVAEEAQVPKAKKEKKFKLPKSKKPKLIKNQAFLKKGSFSLAITAAVIAAAIILNILVGALSDRFVLEFDMSVNKDNSISAENIDYIKSVENDITVTICAGEDTYGSYMGYYAKAYEVNDEAAVDYYKQTITLIKKYGEYNKKINIKFVDPQTTEFSGITSQYSSLNLAYGDIIVSSGDKIKKIGYKDIYNLTEDTTYASYGMTFYTVGSNNIETALTSAISYVTSEKTKKAAIITGHSKTDYTASYLTMLKDNNYETTVISDSMVTSISDEFDMVVIPCPTTDFLGDELDAIAEFLDNDNKLNKGLLFVADVNAPYLKNLYDFLSQWGIVIEEGILFETDSSNHLTGDPMTLGSYATSKEGLLDGIDTCITGYNVPMYTGFESQDGITTTALLATPESPVAAPKNTKATWTGANKYTPKAYNTAILASKEDYDEDNNPIGSYVVAFSSFQFLESEYNEYADISNKNIVLAATEKLSGAEEGGMTFTSKYITEESFQTSVSETAANIIRLIFMILLPVACIVAGVVIYIRRRNA